MGNDGVSGSNDQVKILRNEEIKEKLTSQKKNPKAVEL